MKLSIATIRNLIIEELGKVLENQEELTAEDVNLFLQFEAIGLYKGQETNRLFYEPNRMTDFDSRSHIASSNKAFKEAGINFSYDQYRSVKEKLINKTNQGEKIGNYNITKDGVQNKLYADALLTFMKDHGIPNKGALYSGGNILIPGVTIDDDFDVREGFYYIHNLIDIGFPEKEMLDKFFKNGTDKLMTAEIPVDGMKLPSLKEYKIITVKKIIEDYSKLEEWRLSNWQREELEKVAKGAEEDDIKLADYSESEAADTGFGLYKTLSQKYEYIVKNIKKFESDYNSIRDGIKKTPLNQIPTRRRIIHSFSGSLEQTYRFMKAAMRDRRLENEKNYLPCLMVVEPGNASKTMRIEADEAQTTEDETIIIGTYKTIKLEIKGGIVVQYVKFN